MTGQVNLLQILLHLAPDLDQLLFKVSYSLVLGLGQEPHILALVLKLPQIIFPLELAPLLVLFVLDNLHMQLIVLFC